MDTAFVAEWSSDMGAGVTADPSVIRPVIAFLGEYDALPGFQTSQYLPRSRQKKVLRPRVWPQPFGELHLWQQP